MASNRPLFDDEDLPDWLKAAGITYGGKKAQVPSRPTDQPQTGGDDLSWISEELTDQGMSTAESAGPFVPASDESLPWLQDITPAQPSQPAGASPWGGTLPWESASAEPVAPSDESPLDSPPWQPPRVPDQDLPETKTGVTGMLPWRQDVPADQPGAPSDNQDRLPWEEPVGDIPAAQPEESDWLQGFSLSDTSQPESPATPHPSPAEKSDLGWLDQFPAESAPSPQTASPESAVEDDLSWLDVAPPETTPSEEPPATPAPAFDDLGWMDTAPIETGLPEIQPPEPKFDDDLSWLDAASPETTPPEEPPAVAEPASDNDLSWLNAASSETLPPEEPPAAPEPILDNDLSWLDASASEPASAAEQPAPPEPTPPVEPAAPEPPPAPIKPLKRLPSKPEARPEPPSAVEPPPAPAPIRRLPSTPPAHPAQPPAEAAPRPIQKLPSKPEPQAEPDLSNMSYEEWEQSQIAKEQEALSDPADKLLDEVPEWFSQSNTPPPPTPAQSGPEFLPDWYMGMEEQSAEEAPDWFKNTDLSGTSLAGPETVQTPPSEPAVAAPADEVPDWFKGAGLEDMDFNAMFGAQPSEPEPPPPAAEPVMPPPIPPASPADESPLESPLPPLPSLPPLPDTPPVAEAPASAVPESLDWMTDLPDLTEWKPGEEVQPAEDIRFPISAESASQELLQSTDEDWFAPTAESPSAELAEPTAESTEVPAWMLDQSESSPIREEQAAPDIPEIPQTPETPEEPEAPELAESDIPAWMRDMAPISSNPPLPADAAPELDWLADFDETSIPPSFAPAPSVPPASPAAPEPTPTAESSSTPSGDVDLNAPVDIDSLLSLSSQGGPFTPDVDHLPSAAPVIPVDQSQQALARMDDFDLDELLGPVPEEKQAPQPEINLDELMAEALPPAVRAEPEEPTEPPRAGRLRRVSGTPPQAAPTAESPRPREELPEWLEEMRPSEMPVALHIGDQEVRIQEKPVVQMNDQLRQLRDRARPFHEKQAAPTAPSAGPLSGITGAIQTIPEVIQPGTVSAPSPITAAESQTKRVKLIQRMLELEDAMFRERTMAEEEVQAEPAAKAAVRPRVKIDRYILTLLLVVALIVPFFVDGLNIIPAPVLDQLTPNQSSVAQVVDTIQPGQPVLVAFEYGPTAAGELDDLAKAILRDIIKRGGRPVIVSTNPAGAMRGQIVMALLGSRVADLQLMNRTQPLVTRQDYVVLRYLAGGMAGTRSVVTAVLSGGFQQQVVFSTDIEGKPSGLNDVSGLKNSPAFVVAETADDVRNWAEQYQAPTGEKPFTIVFLTSASASAVADTYVRSVAQTDKHLLGPLVGLRDTMTYQAVRQPLPTSPASSSANPQKLALQRWQSVGLSALLAGVIILIGMTGNMIRSLQRRRRR